MARELKLIQAGVGGMGQTWLNGATAHSPDFDVVAIVDISDDQLVKAGELLALPPERRFKSLAAALDAVDADAVLTVTPPAVHAEHAALAFARGLHVLTEKPLCDSLANARQMVAQATGANRQLVVAQNYRFTAGALRLKSLLAEQPVGAPGHGHLGFYIPGDFAKTFRGQMDYPLLVDMAIHHIDLIRAITGLDIVRVTAHSFRPVWSWYRHDPGLMMHLELTGGIQFSYSGDWAAFGRSTSWNGDWRIQCERGSIHWEQDKLSVSTSDYWGANAKTDPVDIPPVPIAGQARLLADFATAIRTGTPAETSGLDNLNSFATVMAAVKSASEGRTVTLAEILA